MYIVTGVLVLAFIVVAYLRIRSHKKLMRSLEELRRADGRFGDSLTKLKNKAEELDLGEIENQLTIKAKRLDLGKIDEELNGS